MKRNRTSVLVIFALLALAVLLKHLSPTNNLGDAGEFIASNYFLGVSHPPGYPMYGLIGHIFSLAPLGSIAWRVNLASSFAGVTTLIFIYFSVFEITKSHFAALIATLSASVGKLFLEQSLGAEVYIFNAAVLMSLFFLIVKENLIWPLIIFLAGLSFGIHYIILLFLPVIGLKLIFRYKTFLKKPQKIIILLFVFLLGLTCFIYLPIRADMAPPVNWGSPHNFEQFIRQLKRSQYKNLEFGSTVTYRDKWKFLKEFSRQLLEQYQFLLLLLIPILIFIKSQAKKSWEAVLFFILAGLGIIMLLRFKFEELNLARMRAYYLPAFLCLAILIGLGVKKLNGLLRKLPHRSLLLSLVFIAYFLVPLNVNLRANDYRHNFLGYDFGINLLRSLPRDSVFFVEGDNKITPLNYAVMVEGRRPDLIIFDRGRNQFYDIFEAYKTITGKRLTISNDEIEKVLVDFFIKKRPVIFSLRPDDKKFPNYKIYSYGFFSEVLQAKKTLPDPLSPFRFFDYRFKKDELRFKDYMSLDVISNYYYYLGQAYVELGQIDKAADIFVELSHFGGKLKHIHNNLGVLLKRFGYWLAAATEFEKALYLDHNYTEASFNLAQLLEKVDKQKAVSQWRYYLKIAAGNPAEERYIKIAHGRLNKLLGK